MGSAMIRSEFAEVEAARKALDAAWRDWRRSWIRLLGQVEAGVAEGRAPLAWDVCALLERVGSNEFPEALRAFAKAASEAENILSARTARLTRVIEAFDQPTEGPPS